MNTLVLSDLHLGATNSRTDLLAELLDGDFDRLVLNGDTVDRPDPSRLRARDRDVVRRLKAIGRERELIVVRGNHDELPGPTNERGSTRFLSELLETEVHDEYALDVGGERYLVVHGDRFDTTMNLTWVGDAADWCYRGLQRFNRPTAHLVKRASKHVCGVVASVRRGALAYAAANGFDGVITGHTHFWHDGDADGLRYLNTGCWVDWPCSYVRVSGGAARVRHWDGNSVVKAALATAVAG